LADLAGLGTVSGLLSVALKLSAPSSLCDPCSFRALLSKRLFAALGFGDALALGLGALALLGHELLHEPLNLTRIRSALSEVPLEPSTLRFDGIHEAAALLASLAEGGLLGLALHHQPLRGLHRCPNGLLSRAHLQRLLTDSLDLSPPPLCELLEVSGPNDHLVDR
jgi:hypothetical protein